MKDWIEKAQPPVVVLENIKGALWATKVKGMEKLGYQATFLRLDTKRYYMPHTRQWGYLFALRKDLGNALPSNGGVPLSRILNALRRRASTTSCYPQQSLRHPRSRLLRSGRGHVHRPR
mmetsp:Transcript_10873/g.13316  ORF Transcript_10873/g.13316 Transcript_10873/m.13316 type:complete len:119 (+) Transcript_10873:434-790(+)